MKILALGFMAVGATVLMTGCEPQLAQTQLGATEQQWASVIEKEYPSWKAPQVAPPAVRDNMDKSYYEEEARKKAAAEAAKQEQESALAAAPAPIEAEPAVQESIPASAVKEQVRGTEYTVVKGDTLSGIAKKVYKDGRKYNKILKANESVLKGKPNNLKPGMKLFIPAE